MAKRPTKPKRPRIPAPKLDPLSAEAWRTDPRLDRPGDLCPTGGFRIRPTYAE